MGDEMVNVFASCIGLNAYLVKLKTLNLVLIFMAHSFKKKLSKYLLAWNQGNMSEWSNMFNCRLLFQ